MNGAVTALAAFLLILMRESFGMFNKRGLFVPALHYDMLLTSYLQHI